MQWRRRPDPRAAQPATDAALVFDDPERRLAMQLTMIPDKSALVSAIRYALTRKEKRLRPFLDLANLERDNNGRTRHARHNPRAENHPLVSPEAGGESAATA